MNVARLSTWQISAHIGWCVFFVFFIDLYWSNLSLCQVCFIYHWFVLSSLSQSEQPSPASSSSSSGFAPTHHKRQGNLSASGTCVTADVMFFDFFCQSHGLCSYLVVWSVLATKFSFVIQHVSSEINCNIEQGTLTSFPSPSIRPVT